MNQLEKVRAAKKEYLDLKRRTQDAAEVFHAEQHALQQLADTLLHAFLDGRIKFPIAEQTEIFKG